MQARKSTAVIAAAVVFVSGMLPTAIAARTVASRDADQSRESFTSDAEEVASTLKLGIEQAEGLVVNASAYVASNPRTTPAGFTRWAGSARVMQRYPELQALGLIVPVPSRALGAFRAHMLADPILPASRQPRGTSRALQILPAGTRPYYCLAAAGVVRRKVTMLPPGLDYCALAPSLLQARDSGRTTYLPFKEGNVPTVAVQTPVYRGATAPSTVSARREAFVGWLGETLAPKQLLTDALQGRRHIAVTFHYHVGASNVSFTGGAAPAAAQTTTVNLNNGWSVKVAAPAPGGLFSDRGAITWLVGGIVLSLLAAVLMFVIRTARTRAQSLVRRAQHDDLTGLPNRALVLEHAEQLLDESRLAALMFIDVDGFKQVNDGFGHAAGDALLQAVARRLRAAIRLQDMVGRLGGDEFVVLLDAAAGHGDPEALGKRIVQAVREPIRLDGGMVVSVCASVGISTQVRASVNQMLHDADVAVYAAKGAGKGCYRVFEPGMEIAIAKLQGASDVEAGRAAASARRRQPVAA